VQCHAPAAAGKGRAGRTAVRQLDCAGLRPVPRQPEPGSRWHITKVPEPAPEDIGWRPARRCGQARPGDKPRRPDGLVVR